MAKPQGDYKLDNICPDYFCYNNPVNYGSGRAIF